MSMEIICSILFLTIVIPMGVFFMGERKAKRFKNALAVNIISFFSVLVLATVFVFTGNAHAASTAAAAAVTASDTFSTGMAYLGAGLVTGLCTLGTGIATGQAASAALGTISENEGLMGKSLIFVALAEGTAVYGLLISFVILGRV